MLFSSLLTPLGVAAESLPKAAHCPALFAQLLSDLWQLRMVCGGEFRRVNDGVCECVSVCVSVCVCVLGEVDGFQIIKHLISGG